jgi:hypothetical protein
VIITPQQDRFKFGCFGLAIGLFIGVMMGWMFHGFVSIVVRFGIVAILLVPLIIVAWYWFNSGNRTPPPPEDDIPEAEWHEIPRR